MLFALLAVYMGVRTVPRAWRTLNTDFPNYYLIARLTGEHYDTREIGIRLAMGSQRSGILGLILRESILVTIIGIATVLPCALAASRMIAHMLFALSFADPLTLASASFTLLLTGTIAGLLPALRAMKLNPMAALGTNSCQKK
jgi:ABC-type antimicrobial peptide transport system permease subunit